MNMMLVISLVLLGLFSTHGQELDVEHYWTDECGVSQFEDAGIPPWQDNNRVIGGWEVRFNEIPYQAMIQNKSGLITYDPICGGVMINARWVLTSADCLLDLPLETFQVVLGEHRHMSSNPMRLELEALSTHIHPDYVPGGTVADIGLIKMDQIVAYTSAWYPVCRPPTQAGVTFNNTNGIICGWGSEGGPEDEPTNELRCTYLDFADTSMCDALYGGGMINPDEAFCTITTGRDVCTIDRGSPIAVKINGLFHILGISSWSPGCNQGYPSVFMDVSHYYDWITTTILSE